MGAYLYKTKPSEVAIALVRQGIGELVEMPIALYRYAYKPYHGWGRENARMHFRSGAQACENAYQGKEVPALGICGVSDEGRISSEVKRPFQTKGQPCIMDDYVTYRQELEIVAWVKLPKGISLEPGKAVVA